MNSERYMNKMNELYTKMGTIKLNMDRMVLGSISSVAASQYINPGIMDATLIATSITLAFGAANECYKLYRLEKKCEIVQEIYYRKNYPRSYTNNK